jgi:hypothetical protein
MSDLSDLLDDHSRVTPTRRRAAQCEAVGWVTNIRCEHGSTILRDGRRVCGRHARPDRSVTFYDQRKREA